MPADTENYEPVSVFLYYQVFERILYDQLSEYLEKYLNTLLCVLGVISPHNDSIKKIVS